MHHCKIIAVLDKLSRADSLLPVPMTLLGQGELPGLMYTLLLCCCLNCRVKFFLMRDCN